MKRLKVKAAQRFHEMADGDGCITFDQAIPLVRLIAPVTVKPFMQKNLTQLLASYRDDRIDYTYSLLLVKCYSNCNYLKLLLSVK